MNLNYADLEPRDGRDPRRDDRAGRDLDGRLVGLAQEQFPIFGKTGTAERSATRNRPGTCASAEPDRPIVIAVTVEEGGFGDEAAAPVRG